MINGASQGENDTGNIGWNGPCPPPGKPHHYIFTLFALDKRISFGKPPKRAEFDAMIADHIIAKTVYTGLYSK
jgi:Raf kinase inhibitor-like YbhB/YbcL family protein